MQIAAKQSALRKTRNKAVQKELLDKAEIIILAGITEDEMKILIANDDGIQASGVLALAKWARKLGEVVVAAPRHEQSGKSQGIELHKAFEVKKQELAPGIIGYSVDSTPADCVRYALIGLGEHFDLVLSGINRGLNIGPDIMYSGTAGAAFEAAYRGINTLAVSTKAYYYDEAVAHMDEIYDYIMRNDLFALNNLYNINIPKDPKGIRITRQGRFRYSDVIHVLENDMVAVPLGERLYDGNEDNGFDIDAMLHSEISITPLTLERTDMNVFRKLV